MTILKVLPRRHVDFIWPKFFDTPSALPYHFDDEKNCIYGFLKNQNTPKAPWYLAYIFTESSVSFIPPIR
ncbi:MAG: hypothetical protein H6925_00025 [Holosporaceae bacterium]|nr:MAG: hypothetical protein H6925_00025 [Holosporaceae bacterium]